jgi:hypothetical protein
MGLEELELDGTTIPIPLAHGMWLQADDAVELETVATTAVLDTDILFDGLSQLLRIFLDYTDFLSSREILVAFQQFLE